MWAWIKGWLSGVEPTRAAAPVIKEASKPAPPIWLFSVPETGSQPRVTTATTEITAPPAEPRQPVAYPPAIDHLFARRLESVQRLNPPKSRAKNHPRPAAVSGKPRPVPVQETLKRQPSGLCPRIARSQTAPKPTAAVVTLPINRHSGVPTLDREAA